MFMLCFAQLFFSHECIQYHVVDRSRLEQYQNPVDHPYREFMMQVWIPDAQQPSPLILFSHGLGDNFDGMMYQHVCNYCVSQGYIVATVSHTYACKPIQFPDGRISDYQFPAPFHYQSGRHIFDIESDRWYADIAYALNECIHLNAVPTSLLYQKIDASRIGAMGHSLGASAAIQLCRADNRMSAVVNLDGPLYGSQSTYSLRKPMMIIIGSSIVLPIHQEFIWRLYFNEKWLPLLDEFIASLTSDVYKITIDKMVHAMFSDEVLPLDQLLFPYIMEAAKAHEIIHAYVGAFFDKYLKGKHNPLLETHTSPWSEVTIAF
jgi:dienelactone hydrolase